MELVVMAAGMGSRFGGFKQIQPVGPNGEFIIDYSIYDAIRAGFDKVVFIIKEELYTDFKETIGKRIEGKIKVEYVFQNISDVPKEIVLPIDRSKPLGTGHALYCTRKAVTEPFCVISADDFYGDDAFKQMGIFLRQKNNQYCLIGYKIGNTISDNGSVKRGICFLENGELISIVESKVEKKDGIICCEPLDDSASYTIDEDHPVSMLMFGIRPNIYSYIDSDIIKFFNNAKDLNKDEYLLPSVLNQMMQEGQNIKIISTTSVWKGVTYASDLNELKEYINKQIEKGIYSKDLWK